MTEFPLSRWKGYEIVLIRVPLQQACSLIPTKTGFVIWLLLANNKDVVEYNCIISNKIT